MNFPASITVLSFVACLSALGAMDLQPLLDNSPFGRAPVAEAPAAAANEVPLEFRSLVVEQDRRYFSVFDPASQRSYWITDGEAADGGAEDSVSIDFVSYDSDAQQLVVRQDGRALELGLKHADIVASAAPAAVPPANATPRRQVRAGGAADARRLEAVAAEVRRRRALRQSATANQTP